MDVAQASLYLHYAIGPVMPPMCGQTIMSNMWFPAAWGGRAGGRWRGASLVVVQTTMKGCVMSENALRCKAGEILLMAGVLATKTRLETRISIMVGDTASARSDGEPPTSKTHDCDCN